jgi:hypothetical protein
MKETVYLKNKKNGDVKTFKQGGFMNNDLFYGSFSYLYKNEETIKPIRYFLSSGLPLTFIAYIATLYEIINDWNIYYFLMASFISMSLIFCRKYNNIRIAELIEDGYAIVKFEDTKKTNSSIMLPNKHYAYISISDLRNKMSWVEANKFCATLGDGTRLPTLEELKIIANAKEEIGGFKDEYYWSATFENDLAVILNFDNLSYCEEEKEKLHYVRTIAPINAKPYQLDDIEVSEHDLGILNWNEAKDACLTLGNDWRLPTLNELSEMYFNRHKIGITESIYWTSTEGEDDQVWVILFGSWYKYMSSKEAPVTVRAVRSLSTPISAKVEI